MAAQQQQPCGVCGVPCTPTQAVQHNISNDITLCCTQPCADLLLTGTALPIGKAHSHSGGGGGSHHGGAPFSGVPLHKLHMMAHEGSARWNHAQLGAIYARIHDLEGH